MKTFVLKVCREGDSRCIRLPAALVHKYHIAETIIAVEKANEIVLRPVHAAKPRLSWEDSPKPVTGPQQNSCGSQKFARGGMDGL